MKAVSDAGPLIHLAEIKGLWLLSFFEVLYLPEAVWNETVRRGRLPSKELLKFGNVQNCTVSSDDVTSFLEEHGFTDLHLGESECLCLCEQLKVPLFLTDDLAAREAAQKIGFTPVGSLGIVAKVFHKGEISLAEAERYLIDLERTSSLFVTDIIVQQALVRLRSHEINSA
jgi:predicted nucleic acid-binding protein